MANEQGVEAERGKSPAERQIEIFRQGLEGSGIEVVEERDLGTLQKKGFILSGKSGRVEVKGACLNTGVIIPFLQGEGGVSLTDMGVDILERFVLPDGREIEVWEGVKTVVQDSCGPESVSHEVHFGSGLTLNALGVYEVDRSRIDWGQKTMDFINLKFAPTDQRWRVSIGQHLFKEEKEALLSGKRKVAPPLPNLVLHVTPAGEITTTFLTRYVPVEEEEEGEPSFKEQISTIAWQHNEQGLTPTIVFGEGDDRAQEAEGTEREISLHKDHLRRLVFRGAAERDLVDLVNTLRSCDDLIRRSQIHTKKRAAST